MLQDDLDDPSTPLIEKKHWQSTTPSNQNRILLNRRPYQNLIDNEIWTQGATFSTKIGVPIALFWRFFAIFSSTKTTDLAQKRGGSSAQTPILKTSIPALPGLARLCPVSRCRSKPFPHAPEFRKALVGKARLPQTRIAYSSSVDHIKT